MGCKGWFDGQARWIVSLLKDRTPECISFLNNLSGQFVLRFILFPVLRWYFLKLCRRLLFRKAELDIVGIDWSVIWVLPGNKIPNREWTQAWKRTTALSWLQSSDLCYYIVSQNIMYIRDFVFSLEEKPSFRAWPKNGVRTIVLCWFWFFEICRSKIWMMQKSHHWAFWEIQDGRQDGRYSI